MARPTFGSGRHIMRICLDGVDKDSETIRFLLDNETVEASRGDSIASAMIAAGRLAFRKSRSNTDRGMYCGMGVCGECQVLVDGQSKRACMEKVSAGIKVTSHPASRTLTDAATTDAARNWTELSPDVLVVGAGPAGLSAAIAAANSGLEVLLVDERGQEGGQYFKQPSRDFLIDEERLDAQFVEGRKLIRQANELGVRILLNTAVWGTFEGCKVAATTKDEILLIKAKRLILAPGAYERPRPFPGWTLPGVITTGGAQTLLRAYKTAPGDRVLIAGNGPLNLQVARELSEAGVKVVAVVESAASPFASPVAAASLALNDFGLALTGFRHMAKLRSNGVQLHFRHVLTKTMGDSRVRSATVARIDGNGHVLAGTDRHFEVDAVCINNGFLPQSELARSLGCEYDYDQTTGSVAVKRTPEGRTNIENIFVVGDAAVFGGAKIAICHGTLAGHTVARDLNASRQTDKNSVLRLLSELDRNRRFQRALWRMYRTPYLPIELAEPNTIICRCEDLDLNTLRQCISDGAQSLSSLKKLTRAGMGRCQGRNCSSLLATICNDAGFATNGKDFFAPRPPFKPVPLRVLAGSYGQALQPTNVSRISERSTKSLT